MAGVGARTVPRWYALYALIAAWVFLSWRAGPMGLLSRTGGRAWFLAALVVGQLAGDIAGIVVSPIDVRYEVPWAAGRLLDQLFPLLLLGAVALWPLTRRRGTTKPARRRLSETRELFDILSGGSAGASAHT